MSVQPDCLENIIGLSETGCDCFTNGSAIDSTTSQSTLYLDQLEGMNLSLVDAVADCEQGSIWELMDRARNNAVKSFKADLTASLFNHYKPKREQLSTTIGGQKYNANASISHTYAGVRIYCDEIIGGTMTIKRLGLVFGSAETFNVSVYDNVNDTVLETISVTTSANALTWVTLNTPLELDMSNMESEAPEYYLIYEVGTKAPKNNAVTCGCGGLPWYFNTSSPRFMRKSQSNKDRWREFVMVSGISGDTIADRDTWGTGSYANGIILDVDFKCKINDLICSEDMDFETNPYAATMAHAIRYKAGYFLFESFLASGKINRYTMMDRERIMGKKSTYEKEYQNRISWLSQNINTKVNDCLVCRDDNFIFKSGIFS